MTQVRKARNFARRRRLLTVAILALTLGLIGTLTAAAAVGSKGSSAKTTIRVGPNSLLSATATADSCGYSGTTSTFNANTAYSSYIFNESTTLKGGSVTGNGQGASINAFYSDEHALTLGKGATPFSTALANKNFGTATNPSSDYGLLRNGNAAMGGSPLSIGDPTAMDPLHRPIYPAAFVTDLTANGLTSKAGDWQSRNSGAAGGTIGAQTPSFVAGTWKGFDPAVTLADPGKGNGTNLGTEAETFTTNIPGATSNEAYGAEIRWNVSSLKDEQGNSLTAGHKYRVQFIAHDGDQNKTGGDVGEACVVITLPGPPPVTTHPVVGGVTGSANISEPLGSTINDSASVSANSGFPNPTGNVTFHLYFVPAGTQVNLADACVATYDTGFTQTKALTVGNPSTASTSPGYDTTGHGFGTYVWLASYDPNGDPNYTAASETCGAETDTMVDARIRLTPHEATNIVGNAHTVTAHVESTTDGTTWTAVSGAAVTSTLSGPNNNVPATNAFFVNPQPAGACGSTDSAGTCTITINDNSVETVFINATATNFSVTNVTGHFTRSTGTANNTANCAQNDDTCGDAIKHYINPKTTLTVSDQLTGLGSSATGTVTYSAYKSLTDCQGNTNVTDLTPANNNVGAGGVAPLSLNISVAPGDTVYFTAHYVGNEGTLTTQCTAEQASSS